MSSAKGSGTDGRKRRWEQHNAERRRAIIEAAITVLNRDVAPGDEISVQQIADEAAVHRTVLYRYFDDRTDLDLAIQREICNRAGTVLIEALTLEGTVQQIVHRIIGSFVGWAVENTGPLRFVEREVPGAGTKPLDDAIGQMAEQIELVIGGVLALLDVELEDDDRDVLTPLAFLLVGGVMSAVRSWSSRDELRPPVPQFVSLVAGATWLQIEGLAASRSIEVPDLPLEQLLTTKETP